MINIPETLMESPRHSIPLNYQNIERAKAAKSFSLAYTNYNSVLENRIIIAMVTWRNNLGNPTEQFGDMIKVARDAQSTLCDLNPPKSELLPWMVVRFELAALVSGILNSKIDETFYSYCPPWDNWKSAINKMYYPYERFAEVGVLNAILTRKRPDGWEQFIEEYRNKFKKSKLWVESYVTYMEILDTARKSSLTDAIELVGKAAQNYLKRKKDRYYCVNAEWFIGGSNTNDHFVDFVLATIIRCCLPDKGASLTGDAAVHVWRW